MKVAFPKDDLPQTVAVLASAPGPLGAENIAPRFKQGHRITAKVEAVLASLARTGLVDSRDGVNFTLRRVG